MVRAVVRDTTKEQNAWARYRSALAAGNEAIAGAEQAATAARQVSATAIDELQKQVERVRQQNSQRLSAAHLELNTVQLTRRQSETASQPALQIPSGDLRAVAMQAEERCADALGHLRSSVEELREHRRRAARTRMTQLILGAGTLVVVLIATVIAFQRWMLDQKYNSALIAMSGKRWPDAIKSLDDVVASDKSYRDAQARRDEALMQGARSAADAKDWATAVTLAERLPTSYLGSPELSVYAHMGRGKAAQAAQDWQTARAEALRVFSLQANYTDAEAVLWSALAQLPLAKGQIWYQPNLMHPLHGGLPKAQTGQYTKDFSGSQYVLRITDPAYQNAVGSELVGTYDNASIEVSTQLTNEVTDRFVAVACRKQADNSEYLLNVQPANQSFNVVLRQNDSQKVLVDWKSSNNVNSGRGTNTLALTCTGNSIVASINGSQVASLTDGTLSTGKLEFMTGAFKGKAGKVETRFSDLTVKRQ